MNKCLASGEKKNEKICQKKLMLLRQKFQISCSMTITSTKICQKKNGNRFIFSMCLSYRSNMTFTAAMRWGNSSRLERYKNYSWYLFCFFFTSFCWLQQKGSTNRMIRTNKCIGEWFCAKKKLPKQDTTTVR